MMHPDGPVASRRAFLKHLTAVGGSLIVASCRPADDPTLHLQVPCPEIAGKTIRWIVPTTPGGGYEAYSRLLEPFLEATLGAEIAVDHVVGGAGRTAANTLKRAAPDGRTLGFLNGPGLMSVALLGDFEVPHPDEDFTLLGGIARNRMVWFTGRTSPLQTIEDLFAASLQRPILFGITEVGSTTFMITSLLTEVMEINAAYVAGYTGTRGTTLGAIRGDVDMIAVNIDSVSDQLASGELRPLLQISDVPFTGFPALAGLPVVGGAEGVGARRARARGGDVAYTLDVINAIEALLRVGRMVAAPPGLDPTLSQCLEQTLFEILTDPAFEASAEAASWPLQIARPETIRKDIAAVTEYASVFTPLIRAAIEKVRS